MQGDIVRLASGAKCTEMAPQGSGRGCCTLTGDVSFLEFHIPGAFMTVRE